MFLKILKIVDQLPRQYRYDLGSQILRSTLSVSLNMAEGSGKASDPELNRYLDISLGSIYETRAALDVFLAGSLLKQQEVDELDQDIASLASQIGGFKKKLVPKKSKGKP